METLPHVIIGAGPSGLAAALELSKGGIQVSLIEQRDKVGGLARTEQYKGYRFDIGGHRFFTRHEQISQFWHEMLGDDFRKVSRLSRIHYNGCFFDYPLRLVSTMSKLGLTESARILSSYVSARLRPCPREDTFQQWVTNRFGARLYRTFFQTYTEKVWGIPGDRIQADWAAQRIRGLSLTTAITNALFGTNGLRTLIKEFHYPTLGPGSMWEGFAKEVQGQGGRLHLGAEVVSLNRRGSRITSLTVQQGHERTDVGVEQVISSMPLGSLIARLVPAPPTEASLAAGALAQRALVLVGLMVDRQEVFADNWIYVHSPSVKVGRIQNLKNWSAAMVPDARKTSLGMEYFCNEGDALWSLPDAQLCELAKGELARLGLAEPAEVEDAVVFRQGGAYPVYDVQYRHSVQVLRRYVESLDNLQTVGREGMHRYNNQDHSMLTGTMAARNVLGDSHDPWEVNGDQAYCEEGQAV